MPKAAQGLADRRRMYVQSVVPRMAAAHRGLEGGPILDGDTLCRAQRGQVTRLEYLGWHYLARPLVAGHADVEVVRVRRPGWLQERQHNATLRMWSSS
jgi:hypothetical protein